MFYEQYQGAGSWNLELQPNTPQRIRNLMRYDSGTGERGWFGHLIVTPCWVPSDSVTSAQLLAMSIYTGVYYGRSSAGSRLRGYGASTWLGTNDGMSDMTEAAGSFTKTVSNWINDHVLTSAGPSLNGITRGSITASATTYKRAVTLGQSRIEILQKVADRADMQWRINHDLTLDVNTEANLFTTTPTVMLDANSGGRDTNITGMFALFDDDSDVEQFRTAEIVEADDGNPYGWTAAPPFYHAGGAVIIREHYTVASNEDATAGLTFAAILLGRYDDPVGRRRFQVSVPDAYELRRFMEPGDSVYVNHPDLDLFDSANEVNYRGEPHHPVIVRLYGMTSPMREGFGYYFRDSNSAGTITDITEYVRTEDGPATLEVGAVRRSLRVL